VHAVVMPAIAAPFARRRPSNEARKHVMKIAAACGRKKKILYSSALGPSRSSGSRNTYLLLPNRSPVAAPEVPRMPEADVFFFVQPIHPPRPGRKTRPTRGRMMFG